MRELKWSEYSNVEYKYLSRKTIGRPSIRVTLFPQLTQKPGVNYFLELLTFRVLEDFEIDAGVQEVSTRNFESFAVVETLKHVLPISNAFMYDTANESSTFFHRCLKG